MRIAPARTAFARRGGFCYHEGMKRTAFSLLLLSAACLCAHAESFVEITGTRVNLRAAPKGDAEVVAQADYGDRLALHGSLSDPWVAVAVPESCDLWIRSDLLRNGEIAVDRARLRAGAGVNHTDVGILGRGTRLTVRGTFGDWTKVAPPQDPAVSVYVTNLYVRAVASAPAPRPAPPPPAAQPAPPPPQPAPSPAPAPVAPLVVPVEPTPVVEPAAPVALHDVVPAAAPEAQVPRRDAPAPPPQADKGRRQTLLGSGPAEDAPPVGPAKIPSSRLRSGIAQALPGAYAGTLARSPRFGAHPTRFRLVRFDPAGEPVTVCYVYGNTRQLDAMKGQSLTVTGAVYWFRDTELPTVFAQEILRSAR